MWFRIGQFITLIWNISTAIKWRVNLLYTECPIWIVWKINNEYWGLVFCASETFPLQIFTRNLRTSRKFWLENLFTFLFSMYPYGSLCKYEFRQHFELTKTTSANFFQPCEYAVNLHFRNTVMCHTTHTYLQYKLMQLCTSNHTMYCSMLWHF